MGEFGQYHRGQEKFPRFKSLEQILGLNGLMWVGHVLHMASGGLSRCMLLFETGNGWKGGRDSHVENVRNATLNVSSIGFQYRG